VSDNATTLIMEIFRLVRLLQVEFRPILVHLHLSGSTAAGAEWMALLDDAINDKPRAVRIMSRVYNYIHAESSMVFATDTLAVSRKRKAIEASQLVGSGGSLAMSATADQRDGERPHDAVAAESRALSPDGGGDGVPGGAVADTCGHVAVDAAGGLPRAQPVHRSGGRGDASAARPPLFPAASNALKTAFSAPEPHVPSKEAEEALGAMLSNSISPVGDIRACGTKTRGRVCLDVGVSANYAYKVMEKLPWWPRLRERAGGQTHHPFHVLTRSRLIPVTTRSVDANAAGVEDVCLPILWPSRASKVSVVVAMLLLLYDKQPGAKEEIDYYVATVVAGQGLVASVCGSDGDDSGCSSGSEAMSDASSSDCTEGVGSPTKQVAAKERRASLQASRSKAAQAARKGGKTMGSSAQRVRAGARDGDGDIDADADAESGCSKGADKKASSGTGARGTQRGSSRTTKSARSATKRKKDISEASNTWKLDSTASLMLASSIKSGSSTRVIPYTSTEPLSTDDSYPTHVDVQLTKKAFESFKSADPTKHAGVSVADAVVALRSVSHDELNYDWEPPPEFKNLYKLELVLVTEGQHKAIADSQQQVKFLLSPKQVDEAKKLLSFAGEKVGTINIDSPSRFCIKAPIKELLLDENPMLLTYSTLANMSIIHEAEANARVTTGNISFARRVARSSATGTSSVVADGADIAYSVEKMLDAFLKSAYSATVFKFCSSDGVDRHGRCTVVGSDIRVALQAEYMTDAIIDANALCLRDWCEENNKDFYPLLAEEATSIIGCSGPEVSVDDATTVINKLADDVTVCAATQYGFMICVLRKHWVSAIVDVADQKVDIYDSYPGMQCMTKAMPTIVSRLKLFGQLLRDAVGRKKTIRPTIKGFKRKTHSNLKQSDGYNCGPFSFSRLAHAARSKHPTMRGTFGDILRVYMVANVFTYGAKYDRLRTSAAASIADRQAAE